MANLSETRLAALRKAWKTHPNGWEPPGGTQNPYVEELVKSGFVRITDGRCGFECFKDSFLVWTQAGKIAMEGMEK